MFNLSFILCVMYTSLTGSTQEKSVCVCVKHNASLTFKNRQDECSSECEERGRKNYKENDSLKQERLKADRRKEKRGRVKER